MAVIVDASGQPAWRARDERCPQCASSADTRVKSCGFGQPGTICGVCGYDFMLPWREDR